MLNEKGETSSFIANGEWALLGEFLLQLDTKIREDFTITEKAPTRDFSWLKVLSHLRHYQDTMLNRR